jgi:hypothetical protein
MLTNQEVFYYLFNTAIWIDGAPAFGREVTAWLAQLKADGWRAGVLIDALSESERECVRACWEAQAEWRAIKIDAELAK